MTKLMGQLAQVHGEGLLSQVERGWVWQRRRAASQESLRQSSSRVVVGEEGGVWKWSLLWVVKEGGVEVLSMVNFGLLESRFRVYGVLEPSC